MTTDPINLPHPPPGEPVALATWHRLESGRLVLVTTCPSCHLPKSHEWPASIPETLFGRRTCTTCQTQYPGFYWLRILPGAKPPRKAAPRRKRPSIYLPGKLPKP